MNNKFPLIFTKGLKYSKSTLSFETPLAKAKSNFSLYISLCPRSSARACIVFTFLRESLFITSLMKLSLLGCLNQRIS